MKPSPKPRAAIYARYSSAKQNPLSIDDQVTLCRRLIEREFGVDPAAAAVFSDARATGKTMLHRPGLRSLLEAAERKEFDVVVAEGLDRISRNLEDAAAIHARLAYHDVAMHTAHEGRVSTLHVGVKGAMNAIYLDDMKDKIRRSHRARAEEGRVPSSLTYGYRVVRGVVDERNRNVNGLREIDPEQARVVRRIFEEFAAGKHATAIVRGLSGGEACHGDRQGVERRGRAVSRRRDVAPRDGQGPVDQGRGHPAQRDLPGRPGLQPHPADDRSRDRRAPIQVQS